MKYLLRYRIKQSFRALWQEKARGTLTQIYSLVRVVYQQVSQAQSFLSRMWTL